MMIGHRKVVIVWTVMLVVILLSTCAGAFEFGTVTNSANNNASLRIDRVPIGSSDYLWTFTLVNLQNGNGNWFNQFQVNLAMNDGGDLNNGRIFGYQSNAKGATVRETNNATGSNYAIWSFDNLVGGGTAWFSFKTSLPGYDTTDIQGVALLDTAYGQNNNKNAIWHNTPAPVPEPMSMVLGSLGLSSLAGFRRLRRK